MALAIAVPVREVPSIPTIPFRHIVPWAAFIAALALMVVYFVGVEQGALSLLSNHYVHEFVHDARHLAGFPCH